MSWGLVINAAVPKKRNVRDDASGRPGSRCQASDRKESSLFHFITYFLQNECGRSDVGDAHQLCSVDLGVAPYKLHRKCRGTMTDDAASDAPFWWSLIQSNRSAVALLLSTQLLLALRAGIEIETGDAQHCNTNTCVTKWQRMCSLLWAG